jgi:hypothetical protein
MDIIIGLLVAACVFLGAVGGMQLYRWLPDSHLSTETKEVVRLGIGMISILAALVLGLLTASAKNAFDGADQQIRSYAADLTLLDQSLRQYGPEATPIRKDLLDYTERAVRTTWPDPGEATNQPLEDKGAGELLDKVAQQILTLKPHTDEQSWLRGQALDISARLVHTRWTLLMNQQGSVSSILLIIVVVWITVIFASFGLNAPRNATVVAAFLVCALSIGTSIFLILDIDTPFAGVIKISGVPMRSALDHLRVQDLQAQE